MKFKVGDRVKYKQNGEIFKITVVDRSYTNFPYRVKNKSGYECWFEEEELESANYTYEDLKKSPIGTKVTFENGKVLVKDDEDRYENSKTYRHNEDLDGIKDNSDYGRIIKIEEPEYTTVYASKVEILDEVEKRYLRGVIRPFRDKVTYIEKANAYDCSFIRIATNEEDIVLPHFKADAMYKGMKTNKAYTLEELGL